MLPWSPVRVCVCSIPSVWGTHTLSEPFVPAQSLVRTHTHTHTHTHTGHVTVLLLSYTGDTNSQTYLLGWSTGRPSHRRTWRRTPLQNLPWVSPKRDTVAWHRNDTLNSRSYSNTFLSSAFSHSSQGTLGLLFIITPLHWVTHASAHTHTQTTPHDRLLYLLLFNICTQ